MRKNKEDSMDTTKQQQITGLVFGAISLLLPNLGDEDGKYIETIRGQGYRLNL